MELTAFHYVIGTLALIMLIWNTVEVGRNDAANIVNAVFGARVMTRRKAVWLAGIAVEAGAALIIDADDVANMANDAGLFVYGFSNAELETA